MITYSMDKKKNGTGRENWKDYARHIQSHGNLGAGDNHSR